MASAGVRRGSRDVVGIYEEEPRKRVRVDYRTNGRNRMDESRNPLDDSGCTRSADSEDDEEIEVAVAEDMRRLEESFHGFSRKYRLINRIGEGTFSTVFKAEDLQYDRFKNTWDLDDQKENRLDSPSGRKTQRRRKPHYVAIKKIYVTSSPSRIMNELELLHDLRHYRNICPLITAFRDKDQVIAILPYFRHLDFRAYFKDLGVADMRHYFRSLFTALTAVHHRKILHRDIKPTNFLYDTVTKHGVLVDFGLAERQDVDYQPCICELHPDERQKQQASSQFFQTHRDSKQLAYPKHDTRPSLRANRAGTRGFRAPEVLFKCTAQTTKIDVWAAGIILLTILARRFPFFNSPDDIDAVVELGTLFGKEKMKKCALLHGQIFESNIPTIVDNGHSLEKIIVWSTRAGTRDRDGRRLKLSDEQLEAVQFLDRCLELDPRNRISAAEALEHPFLTADLDRGSEDEADVLSWSSPS